MDVGGVELEHALGPLGDLADTSRAAEVELRRKPLRSDQLRVLLVGEAKRGKSTLGNALLGRDILPTGVTPLTAVTTTVTDGHPERIHVIYTDGRTQEAAVEDLSQFVTENGNRHNHRESRGSPWFSTGRSKDCPPAARRRRYVRARANCETSSRCSAKSTT